MFNRIFTAVWSKLQREEGQATAEYALILGLVVVGAIALYVTLGESIQTILTNVTEEIP